MIDVLLGLLLMFFALAAVCSFVQERIASLFSLRQRNAYRALQSMLESSEDPLDDSERVPVRIFRDAWSTAKSWAASAVRGRPSNAVDALMRDPRLKALRGRGWFGVRLRVSPSYIPRDLFVVASKRIAGDPLVGLSPDAFRLLNTLDDKELGDWFDATMERAAGWYRRQTQVFLIVIATVIVVTFNVDVINVTRVLLTNAEVREALARSADNVAKGGGDTTAGVTAARDILALHEKSLGFTSAECIEQATKKQEEETSPTSESALTCLKRSLSNNIADTPSHFFGWLLAIIAASAGAPFWFDLLSKVSSMRSTGTKPEPRDE